MFNVWVKNIFFTKMWKYNTEHQPAFFLTKIRRGLSVDPWVPDSHHWNFLSKHANRDANNLERTSLFLQETYTCKLSLACYSFKGFLFILQLTKLLQCTQHRHTGMQLFNTINCRNTNYDGWRFIITNRWIYYFVTHARSHEFLRVIAEAKDGRGK